MQVTPTNTDRSLDRWLQLYYFLRTGVSLVWIALAVLVGKQNPAVGAVLLVAYPAWDALANYLDARTSGGLGANPSQKFNFAVSVLTGLSIWAGPSWYGMGFACSLLVVVVVAMGILNARLEKLEYETFMLQ